MHAPMPLVVTLAAALGLALVLGFVALRLRLPALVGYLVAGVLIGPFTPGFVADVALASQLAEVGVMLLMFGVGLHFSVADLLAVRRIAVPGALVQMGVATALGAGLALAWGWTMGGALVFGLALSVASTVVLLRALEARNELDTGHGRVAVGWLVVEDLAMVLVLVLLPVLAGLPGADAGAQATGQGGGSLAVTLGRTLLAVGAFVAVMLLGGRRVLPWLLWQISRTGSRELFTLCVVAVAVGIAYGAAALFGVSVALGAFFAGLVLRESPLSHRAAEESLPFRDAFAVLFFVSVGMLFDPQVLVDRPLQVLAVVAVVVLGKSLAAATLVLALRHPLRAALGISASLAQIGEFSFILVALGASLGLLPPEAQSLVVAGALLSIALNPLLFGLLAPAERWMLARWHFARRLAARDDPLAALPQDTDVRYLARQVVLVGQGPLGRHLAAELRARQQPCVVVTASRDEVQTLRDAGLPAVAGDMADPETLVQAHIAQAGLLVLTEGDCTRQRPAIDIARTLNPTLPVIAYVADADQAQRLAGLPGVQAVHADEAVAARMLQLLLAAQASHSASVPAGAVPAHS